MRVLDRNGHEIVEGAGVRTTYDGSQGQFMEPRWQPGKGWVARVFYCDPVGSQERMEPGGAPDCYRCPDLLLADSEEVPGA